jgi:hypothetical protein
MNVRLIFKGAILIAKHVGHGIAIFACPAEMKLRPLGNIPADDAIVLKAIGMFLINMLVKVISSIN